MMNSTDVFESRPGGTSPAICGLRVKPPQHDPSLLPGVFTYDIFQENPDSRDENIKGA
jgi:hypothetical protein